MKTYLKEHYYSKVPADPNSIGYQEPESLQAEEGEEYTLRCMIPNIKRTDTISWFKNGSPIHSSISRDLSGSSITFRSVDLADGGSYICVKNDDLASSYAVDLTVLPRGLYVMYPFFINVRTITLNALQFTKTSTIV